MKKCTAKIENGTVKFGGTSPLLTESQTQNRRQTEHFGEHPAPLQTSTHSGTYIGTTVVRVIASFEGQRKRRGAYPAEASALQSTLPWKLLLSSTNVRFDVGDAMGNAVGRPVGDAVGEWSSKRSELPLAIRWALESDLRSAAWVKSGEASHRLTSQ